MALLPGRTCRVGKKSILVLPVSAWDYDPRAGPDFAVGVNGAWCVGEKHVCLGTQRQHGAVAMVIPQGGSSLTGDRHFAKQHGFG